MYKKGDKVILLPLEKVKKNRQYGEPNICSQMYTFFGNIITIDYINCDLTNFKSGKWWYSFNWIDLDYFKIPKEFFEL